MNTNYVKVKDYDKKIDIWENAYGNSNKSKLDDMDIDKSMNRYDATVTYAKKIINEDFEDIKEIGDTFTYLHEIEGGYEKDTYEDIPYLIPYIVEGSKDVVIVLSGGGFAYKTIDGSTSGGKRVAERLNDRNISCFLLHYRANPYKFPIPMLDLQRAIRFVRYNSEKYSYDRNRISLMGFSSGGYVVSNFINNYIGKNHFDKNYTLDEIDKESDDVFSASMIYAPFTFYYNVPMICATHNKKDYIDEFGRENLLQKLDLRQNIDSEMIPQFISYSDGDKTIDFRGTEKYIDTLKQNGGNVFVDFVENEDHGYSDDIYMDEYEKWIKSL